MIRGTGTKQQLDPRHTNLISVVEIAGNRDLRVIPPDSVDDLVGRVPGLHGLHQRLEADVWLVAKTRVYDVRTDGSQDDLAKI